MTPFSWLRKVARMCVQRFADRVVQKESPQVVREKQREVEDRLRALSYRVEALSARWGDRDEAD